jgi:uncharacterized MAPEG superfamily protein
LYTCARTGSARESGDQDTRTAVVYLGGGPILWSGQLMTMELQYLVWVAILTLFIRVTWMADKVMVRGLAKVTGYPDDSEPLSGWGRRTWIAHEDAILNLVIFTVLVLALHLAGESNDFTRAATAVYFWARLCHFIVYAFAIPRIKTVAFVVAFCAQLVLAWQFIWLAWQGG